MPNRPAPPKPNYSVTVQLPDGSTAIAHVQAQDDQHAVVRAKMTWAATLGGRHANDLTAVKVRRIIRRH